MVAWSPGSEADSDVEEGETRAHKAELQPLVPPAPTVRWAGRAKTAQGQPRGPGGKDTPTFLAERYLITYPRLNDVSEALLI